MVNPFDLDPSTNHQKGNGLQDMEVSIDMTDLTRVIFVHPQTRYLYSDRRLTIPFLCNVGNGGCSLQAKLEGGGGGEEEIESKNKNQIMICDLGHVVLPDFKYELMEF